MGKLVTLIVLLALGYAGVYVYYGVVIEQEVEQQLEARGLSTVSVDNVEYGLLAPVSNTATIAVTVGYRGSQAAVNMSVQGHPLFSDDVTVQLDSLQALRLGINFGQ
ncbi:hypothetical protein R5M92_08360 [Halomonas sp. Bachu 37]|uniref:hypothetical protein n=1 Tax=Halomonas kashgarensis TaxID=3084920 RepID=UPI003216DF15